MKILLTQQEWLKPPNFWAMDAVERSWYRFLNNHEVRVAPNIPESFQGDPDWDCLVITGGPDSLARNQTENLLMQKCLDHDIPMIGVCHGAFALNDYLGGVNGTIDGHAGTEHDIIMDGETYLVNSYHQQSLERLAEMLEPCAYSSDGIEAFRHVSRKIWGVVWHPERMAHPVLPGEISSFLQSA